MKTLVRFLAIALFPWITEIAHANLDDFASLCEASHRVRIATDSLRKWERKPHPKMAEPLSAIDSLIEERNLLVLEQALPSLLLSNKRLGYLSHFNVFGATYLAQTLRTGIDDLDLFLERVMNDANETFATRGKALALRRRIREQLLRFRWDPDIGDHPLQFAMNIIANPRHHLGERQALADGFDKLVSSGDKLAIEMWIDDLAQGKLTPLTPWIPNLSLTALQEQLKAAPSLEPSQRETVISTGLFVLARLYPLRLITLNVQQRDTFEKAFQSIAEPVIQQLRRHYSKITQGFVKESTDASSVYAGYYKHFLTKWAVFPDNVAGSYMALPKEIARLDAGLNYYVNTEGKRLSEKDYHFILLQLTFVANTVKKVHSNLINPSHSAFLHTALKQPLESLREVLLKYHNRFPRYQSQKARTLVDLLNKLVYGFTVREAEALALQMEHRAPIEFIQDFPNLTNHFRTADEVEKKEYAWFLQFMVWKWELIVQTPLYPHELRDAAAAWLRACRPEDTH